MRVVRRSPSKSSDQCFMPIFALKTDNVAVFAHFGDTVIGWSGFQVNHPFSLRMMNGIAEFRHGSSRNWQDIVISLFQSFFASGRNAYFCKELVDLHALILSVMRLVKDKERFLPWKTRVFFYYFFKVTSPNNANFRKCIAAFSNSFSLIPIHHLSQIQRVFKDKILQSFFCLFSQFDFTIATENDNIWNQILSQHLKSGE